jgi:hypothetical protein
MPLLPVDRARGRWGNIPALSAVSPRRCRPPAVRGLTCEVKAKHKSGSPAARANHARSPKRGPSGAETGARMGRSIELTEPSGSARRSALDLSAPIPPKHEIARKAKRNAAQATEYSLAIDLPDTPPITEIELRALEILLGPDLKELLAETPGKPLKYQSD